MELAIENDHKARASERAQGKSVRLAFVTNFCPHYRVKTFELLAERFDADFYFYSDGSEWYWQKQHGTQKGNFAHEYLRGFWLFGTRITPWLPASLRRGDYQAVIKCSDGRFALAATYLTARLSRRPFILWTGIWSNIDSMFHRIAAPAIRHIYRRASAIAVYGEHVKRYLVRMGIPGEKIFVAAHAVDNELYAQQVPAEEIWKLRAKLRLKPTDRVILFLGRLEECKGLKYLLEAFRRVKGDAALVIAGDGTERTSLENMAVDFGIEDRIRFAGYVAPEETIPYYAMAYALAFPSVTMREGKETWGLVVNEAMNQGLPVIASDIVGAAAGGLVRDGVNGFVVPERDAATLARAIESLLASNRLREEMSANARRIIAEWDNEQMVQGFERAIAYAMHKDDPLLTSL
ncbi:MAG TPA: glycosyltransferase family 4 protein [Candidatus Acidoferrales bacterium]|nr:glycosyltransferase family 4 protein [Candidatus Acidoferrales bacterium]